MGRPQRFRGVRQRHWGSWVSEIRHPLLKTRVWLGTFETAEDAAHAYDEAARLMCGARARTNFPYDPHAPERPSSQLLSATLTAKLHRWHLQSQQHAADGGTKPGTGKNSPAPPLPCLCLHNQARSKLANLYPTDENPTDHPTGHHQPSTISTTTNHCDLQPANSNWFSEEDKFAAEMIEELLSWRSPSPGVSFISGPSTSDSSCSSPFSATVTASAASSPFVM